MLWICCKSHETNLQHHTVSNITIEQSSFYVSFITAAFQEEIVLQLSTEQAMGRFSVSVTLYQDRIPKVRCDNSFKNVHLYVFAWNLDQNSHKGRKTTKLYFTITVTQAALTKHSKHFSTAKVLHMPMKLAPIV